MKKVLGIVFCLAGITLVLSAFVLTGKNVYEQWQADKNATEVMGLLNEKLPKEADGDSEEIPLYKLYPDMEMPAEEINGYRYIGKLEIPSEGLELPVMEEWDYTRLNIAPCRFSGSAYTNDLVIAGHDYYNHFTPIKQLSIASPVIFTDCAGNVFHYKVAWTEVLQPTEVEALQSEVENNEWDLTLFTCTFSGSERYTVRCILDEEQGK